MGAVSFSILCPSSSPMRLKRAIPNESQGRLRPRTMLLTLPPTQCRGIMNMQLSFCGVAVITCASHAQGPRFDPGQKHIFPLPCPFFIFFLSHFLPAPKACVPSSSSLCSDPNIVSLASFSRQRSLSWSSTASGGPRRYSVNSSRSIVPSSTTWLSSHVTSRDWAWPGVWCSWRSWNRYRT